MSQDNYLWFLWKINVSGDIFNDGGNDEDQKDYGFTSSFFNIAPTIIDDITKNESMKIQPGILYTREIYRILTKNMMKEIG